MVMYLTVTVIAGKDLSPKDENGFSDPYCVLRLNNDNKGGAKKTHFVKKSLSPTWNETFEFGEINQDSILKLTCWDHDRFSSDDFMGQVSVNLGHLCKEETSIESWFILQGRGKEGELIGGRIHLQLSSSFNAQKVQPKSFFDASFIKKQPNLNRQSSLIQVFCTEIEELMKRQALTHPDLLIPISIKSIIDYLLKYGLEEVGLFRLAGSHAEIQELKNKLNMGETIDNEKPIYNIHDIGTLFKRFFRELPTPLLTYNFYHSFIASVEHGEMDSPEFIEILKKKITELPRNNFFLLTQAINLLVLITANSAFNKMSTQNLSICIGPNLLWAPPDEGKLLSNLSNFDQASRISLLTEILIQQRDYIFQYDHISKIIEVDETIAVGKEAMRLFLTYDTNGDGVMDKDEFSIFYTDMLKEFGIPPPSEEDIETAIKVLDKDKNNEVSFEEFSGWWQSMNKGKGRRYRNKKPAVVAVSGRRFTTVIRGNNNNNNNDLGVGHSLGRTNSSGTIEAAVTPVTNLYHSSLAASGDYNNIKNDINNNNNVYKSENDDWKNNSKVRFDVEEEEKKKKNVRPLTHSFA